LADPWFKLEFIFLSLLLVDAALVRFERLTHINHAAPDSFSIGYGDSISSLHVVGAT
jgi:hypothetical protein